MSFSKILVSNVCPRLTVETAVYIFFDNFFQVCSLNIEIGVQKLGVFMRLVNKLPFMNCISQPSLIKGSKLHLPHWECNPKPMGCQPNALPNYLYVVRSVRVFDILQLSLVPLITT